MANQDSLRTFQTCYKMCCKSENILPLKILKNNGLFLEFCTDKVKYIEWAPIFIALSDDLSLQSVLIFCRLQNKSVMEHIDCDRLAKNVSKYPVILTSFMLANLSDAISLCLSQSTSLTVLQIEGLPLHMPYITPITDALSVTKSLKHLSFQSSPLGDAGCYKICQALRCRTNIVTINLSACELTCQGASYIAELIKYHKNYRYSENWKQTLRYRSPDLDSMSGLRRVTLSGNQKIEDKGLLYIFEVLLDDLWIKAIDVQQCGLTENSVKNSLRLMEYNTTLHILDLHYNSSISMKSLSSISSLLRKNESSSCDEQHWYAMSKCSLVNKQKITNKDGTTPARNKILHHEEKHSNPKLDLLLKSELETSKTKKDFISMNILRNKLKEEITYRRHLEDLNERLVHQVKELKQQQINYWKSDTCVVDSEESNIMLKTKQKPQKTLIDLTGNPWSNNSIRKNSTRDHKTSNKNKLDHELDAEKRNNFPFQTENYNNYSNNEHAISQYGFQSNSGTYEDLSQFKNKICTGAEILEELLSKRLKALSLKNHPPELNKIDELKNYSFDRLLQLNRLDSPIHPSDSFENVSSPSV